MRALLVLALLLMPATAGAATLISTASGNINATATWSVVDTTGTNALLLSESANTALTTTPVASSTFTPAAETLIEIGVKLASVAASPSGTITIKLANSTSPGSRECTQTVNVADLVSASATTAEGGLVILTCAASPNGTDAYTIDASTSVASQVNLFSSATTNWSRLLVTTGTKSGGPAAGDNFIVEGQLTGQGTHNAYTVTVNTTSNINYGSASNTLVSPSIAIGQYGTLAYGTSSATNYAMEVAGPLVINNGGTFDVGTSGTPIPMSSSCTNSAPCATFTLNSTTEGDTGITARNGGALVTNGSPRNASDCSTGMACVQTHLFENVSAGAITQLDVLDNTGWQSGDVVVLASTDKEINNGTETEKLTLSGNAASSTLPISATLAFAHLGQSISYTSTNNGYSYTFPEEAEIILLTRNVRIQGSSDSTPGYIYCQPLSNCSMVWTEFQHISGNVSTQYGIDSDTEAGGTFLLQYDSDHDATNAGIVLGDTSAAWGGTSADPATVQYVTEYNVSETGGSFITGSSLVMGQFTTNINWIIDNLTVLSVPQSNYGIYTRAVGGQFSNIVCADAYGGSGPCLSVNFAQGTNIIPFLGDWGPITEHSNTDFDVSWGAAAVFGSISGIYVYHSYGWFWSDNNNNITVNPMYGLGNTVFQAGSKGNVDLTLMNGFLANDAVSGARPGFGIDENFNNMEWDNIEVCPTQTVSITQASGTTTGNSLFVGCSGSGSATSITPVNDVGLSVATPTTLKLIARNSPLLAAPDETNPGFLGQNYLTADSYVCADWIDNHKCFMTFGIDTYDTAITIGGSASERVTPQIIRTTGYISGSTLTTTVQTYPNLAMSPNIQLNAVGILSNTIVIADAGGLGNAGNYTVNNPQTLGSSGSPVTITGPLGRLPSAPFYQGFKVAVPSGQTRRVCVSMRESSSSDTNGINYTGDAPRLIVRMNPTMGVMSDTVAATFTSGLYGQVQQECVTTPTAPQDGVFEYIVDADMSATSNAGGWINVGGWTATN